MFTVRYLLERIGAEEARDLIRRNVLYTSGLYVQDSKPITGNSISREVQRLFPQLRLGNSIIGYHEKISDSTGLSYIEFRTYDLTLINPELGATQVVSDASDIRMKDVQYRVMSDLRAMDKRKPLPQAV